MDQNEKLDSLAAEVEKLKEANKALMQTVKLQQAINEKIIMSLREIREHIKLPFA